MSISVVGTGVGTLTAARLLGVGVEDGEARCAPVLVLNEVTLGLLCDLWGPAVLDGAQPITVRRVRWGPGASEVAVPVTSAVIAGRTLVERLRAGLPSASPGGARWLIDGRPRDGISFGERVVIQADVSLTGVGPGCVWVETVEDGWVHLLPTSAGRGVVQVMVPAITGEPAVLLARMLAATVSIGRTIDAVVGPPSVFAAAPRLAVPACGSDWLAVADGAVRLDPISGSGTAWSLRSGVLAAAVVNAVASGMPEADCLRHYDDRLRLALFDHVAACVRLYTRAFSSAAWRQEIHAMRVMLGVRGPATDFSLRLNQLRLEPVS